MLINIIFKTLYGEVCSLRYGTKCKYDSVCKDGTKGSDKEYCCRPFAANLLHATTHPRGRQSTGSGVLGRAGVPCVPPCVHGANHNPILGGTANLPPLTAGTSASNQCCRAL